MSSKIGGFSTLFSSLKIISIPSLKVVRPNYLIFKVGLGANLKGKMKSLPWYLEAISYKKIRCLKARLVMILKCF